MPDQLAKSLVAAAMELHRRRPWLRVPGEAPVVLRLPDEEHPVIGLIVGQDDSEYGLMLLRGVDAFASFTRIAETGDAVAVQADLLSLSFEPLGELAPEYRALLTAAGFSARRESLVPLLFAKRAGQDAKPPGRGDMRLLLAALRALLAADAIGELDPSRPDEDGSVLEITALKERPKGEPPIRVARREWSWPRSEASGGSATPESLADLPQRQERWLAVLVQPPAEPGEVERGEDELFILTEGDERILSQLPIQDLDLETAADAITEACLSAGPEGEHGRPLELVFDSQALHDALAPALESLGMKASVAEIRQELRERLEVVLQEQLGPGYLWRNAEDEVRAQFREDEGSHLLRTSAMLKRFFGDAVAGRALLDEGEDPDAELSFEDWCMADLRRGPGAPTWIEAARKAARGLEPRVREVMDARRDAYVSIFRVDRVEDNGWVLEAVDILSGERHRIIASAPMPDGEGLFLPLRLLHVGGMALSCSAGPPLAALQVNRALARLEELGARLSREGLRPWADKLGSLWVWACDEGLQATALENTDGESFRQMRASFAVADVGVLAGALAKREDVEVTGDHDWTWLVPERGSRAGGAAKVLARLEHVGDQLLVEANSQERLERARAWLEEIEGVRFLRMSERALGEETPLDDRLVGEGEEEPQLDAEQREEVERVLQGRFRAWLDAPVPMLGDQTPRQACSSAEGRERVARLIQTMPAVAVPWGEVVPPREELLRELGLGK